MKKTFFAALLIFITVQITAQEERYNYPDQIKCHFMPKSSSDKGDYYTNKGAWHGYSLPKNSDTENYGNFGGPYCLKTEKWISPSLLNLKLVVVGKGEIDLSKASKKEIAQYPGLLRQQYIFPDFRLELNLEPVDTRTSLYQALAINSSEKDQNFSMSLKGSMFEGLGEGESFPDGWMFKIDGKEDILWVIRFRLDAPMELSYSPLEYEFKFKQTHTVKPGDTLKITAIVSQYFNGDTQDKVLKANELLTAPQGFISNNKNLWDYLFNHMSIKDSSAREISIKSLQSLYQTLRSSLPGLANFAFYPFINPDTPYTITDESWFTASAELKFDPRLSFNQFIIVMSSLNEDGSLNKYISLDPAVKNESKLIEKPMAAWTAWNIYLVAPDADFLAQSFPVLEKYLQYWYNYHDVDNNGWCETSEGVESVALNAMLFTELHCMSKMSEILNDTLKTNYYRGEIERIYMNFNIKFFDLVLNRYCDYDIKTSSTSLAQNAEGYCFWAGLANQSIAEIYAREITQKINTDVFFEMLEDYKIESGYFYILSAGLKSYNYIELSEAIKQIYIIHYSAPFNGITYHIKDQSDSKIKEYSSVVAAVMLLMTNY